MIEQTGNAITFYAQFLVSGAGGTGLTITCTVYKGSDGSAVVSGQAATEIGGGLYKYTLASGSVPAEDDILAVFNEAAATADQTDVPSMWTIGKAGVENLDANVAGVETKVDLQATAVALAALDTKHDATDAALAVVDGVVDSNASALAALNDPSAAAVADAVWDETLSGHAAAGSAGEALASAGGAADPLLNAVPGSYSSGTAGAALGRIGTAEITASVPVGTDGTVALVRGDDYDEDDSRELSFSSTGWPDLTGATAITLSIRKRASHTGLGSTLRATVADTSGSRVVGGGTQTVVFEPTASDTADLDVGTAACAYDVQATLASGNIVTLSTGVVNVTEDQTRA